MKPNIKILEISVLIAMLATIIISVGNFDENCMNIEDEVFRLHVIANSDNDADQKVKLKVRDAILKESQELFEGKATKKQAEEIVQSNLSHFRDIAEKTLRKNGFDNNVSVEIGKSRFPTRTYGETTLPAGEYDALRVIIGNGEGHNWWCVMFPPLCLPAAEKNANLSDVLSDEELDIVSRNPRFEMRFWIVEKIRQLK